MIEIVERIIHLLGSIAVFGILAVEIDDVYGWSQIRKLSKRRARKFWKKFMKDSKKYISKRERYYAPKTEQSDFISV